MTDSPTAARGSLLDVFRAFPDTALPLLDYHEAVMRGPSPLSVAERELVAAFVSALNSCVYCHGVHAATATAFGIPEEVVRALLVDVTTAPVDERMKPLLQYVAKLTEEPSRVTPADAALVVAAGWDDRALHDAVSVCGLFNLMNRIVDGLGVTADDEYIGLAGRRLADTGYAALKELIRPTPRPRGGVRASGA